MMRRFIIGLLPDRVRWWLLVRQLKSTASAMAKLGQACDAATTALGGSDE